MNNTYRKDIDGLRGIAVIAVIINHFNPEILPGGYLGVDIFFAISGYVITQSLSTKDYKTLRSLLKDFYARRVKRILPALIFMVITASLLTCIFHNQPAQTLRTGIASLWGLGNLALLKDSFDYFASPAQFNTFTHTWSLAVEEQFYLLFPIIIWTSRFFSTKENRLTLNLITFLSIISVFIYIYLSAINPSAAYYLTPARFWEMGAGCICFLAVERDRRFIRTKNIMQNKYITVIGVVFILLLFIHGEPNLIVISTICTIFATLTLLIGGNNSKSIYNRLTCAKPLLVTGLLSYSLYLWHWPILAIAKTTVGVTSVTTPALILLILFFSTISYYYIETPIRAIKFEKNIWTNKLTIILIGIIALILATLLTQFFKSNYYRVHIPKVLGASYSKIEVDCLGKVITEDNPRNESLDYCFSNRSKSKSRFYLLGDSHAHSLLPMVQRALSMQNIDAISIPNEDDYIEKFWQNKQFSPEEELKIIDLIKNSREGDFVGISFHRGHLNNQKNKDFHVPIEKSLPRNSKEINAFENFDNLIALLISKGLNPILFRDSPLLSSPIIPVSSCIIQNKFSNTDLCRVSKSQDDHTSIRQDRVIDSISQKYDLPVFDPSKFMLLTNPENFYSWYSSKGEQIMSDHSHISVEYSRKMSNKFAEFFNSKF